MDAMEQAKRYLDGYEDYRSLRDTNPDRLKADPATYPTVAMAYAAIAQAEAMQQIVEYLNCISNQLTHVVSDNAEFSIAESLYGIEKNTR